MDKNFLLTSVNLAKKNRGLTSPNPCVGCIIVKNGEILSFGVTQKGGIPHAETVAIDRVADKTLLVGATIYVSLEPCCHFGRTPPCVDKIIDAKISRVVIGAIDNDPRVSGKGIEKLRENGVKTDIIEIDEAYEINRGFFKAKKFGLPFVTLKLAVSLDGKIACHNFSSQWITNEKSRKFSHYLRSINDGILIGKNTLLKDNPRLDCRILGAEECSPKKFVIGDFSGVSQDCNFIGEVPSFSLNFEEKDDFFGAKTILCEGKKGEINLKSALEKICENGVNSLLVEGGSKLATNLLRQNLVDELIWIQSDKIIGDDGIAAISELGIDDVNDALQNFKRVAIEEFDSDLASFFIKK